MIAVHGISASAEIVISSVRPQQIICPVIDTPERYDRSFLISFRRVIEHYIENDLYTVLMEQSYHILQLIRFHSEVSG